MEISHDLIFASDDQCPLATKVFICLSYFYNLTSVKTIYSMFTDKL